MTGLQTVKGVIEPNGLRQENRNGELVASRTQPLATNLPR